jgi:hypothetical protein
MPRTKTAKRVRFVKDPHPGATRPEPVRRAPTRKARPEKARPEYTPASPSADFPTWKDLAADNGRELSARQEREGRLATVPTVRLAGLIGLLALLFTGYVGHVHATQELAGRVQSLQRRNLTLHLTYNQVKGRFDQATAPSVIYERTRPLGLSEAIPDGFPILTP